MTCQRRRQKLWQGREAARNEDFGLNKFLGNDCEAPGGIRDIRHIAREQGA